MTDTVFVSALIRQRVNSTTFRRSIDTYLDLFPRIVETGSPIVLFLDRSLVGEVKFPNVQVIPMTLGELDTYAATAGQHLDLPRNPAETHVRPDLLVIINAKSEFIRRASPYISHARCVAWIDFGVFHCVKDVALTQRRLQSLPVTEGRVTIPGIWGVNPVSMDSINWRFCGGIYWGSPESMTQFSALHEATYRRYLPKLAWEVNLWARMEAEGLINPVWYASDHNDTMFAYPGAWQPGDDDPASGR